jgi:oxygen-independent coproporphyrinogen-3 oxidase
MFAIPDQTLEAWRTTLAEALAFGSEHLSCYEVIYEEDTPLFEQLRAGQCDVDEDLACDMYDALLDLAEQHGFRQYEIANFARRRAGESAEIPVLACRHNINYWRGGSFQGLGPSAASYIGGVRARNAANTTVYCERLERGERPVESAEQLSPLARAGEIAAFGLRMSVGWQFDEFLNVTGFDLRNEWAADMEWLRRQGLGQLSDNRFHLTRRGLRFADLAAQRFLRP